MDSVNPSDLTKPLIEADEKAGSFEPDPNEPLVIRYVPSAKELDRINTYLAAEIEQAWIDDQPSRNRCLDLLTAYRAEQVDSKQPIVTPLIKRAVKQNVAWIKRTIMQHKPLVTVTPDSNQTINVLIRDPQFGDVQIPKTSEESAQALEWWLEYKLRKKVPFDMVVEIAAKEAKRGQTPTAIKVCRNEEFRTTRAPRFGQSGPAKVSFEGKDDVSVLDGEATQIINVSRYNILMPADEQNHQKSRWFAEFQPQSSDDMRARLVNGLDYLIPEKEWESFISDGHESEPPPDEQRKAALERRVSSLPPDFHPTWLVWLFWPVKMKSSVVVVDDEGEQKTKTTTVYKKFSFVGYYHRRNKRLMSMIRLPYDHGWRPYTLIYDDQEPFRNADESLADDAWPYQRTITSLENLEIKGGVIATTPVFYYEPGSVAGDWLMETGDVQPGDFVPRQREDEIEGKVLADRPVSLIGLIQHKQQDYEHQFQIGSLMLGQSLPGRTPASTLAQAINQGETQATQFLDSFRLRLGEVVKMYVQTEQQYMRFGEVIPFDEETKATIEAALGGQASPDDGIAVRFPTAPIHSQFAFNITASSDDRSQQGDVERLIALKNMVDEDANINAQVIQPLASGKLSPAIVELYVQDIERRQYLLEQITKLMRKDSNKFVVDPKKFTAMAEQQAIAAQAAAQAAAQSQGGQQQPKISISLSGKLTQEQESEAAMQQGLGRSIGPQGTSPGQSGGPVSASGEPQQGAMGPMVSGPGNGGVPIGNPPAVPHPPN